MTCPLFLSLETLLKCDGQASVWRLVHSHPALYSFPLHCGNQCLACGRLKFLHPYQDPGHPRWMHVMALHQDHSGTFMSQRLGLGLQIPGSELCCSGVLQCLGECLQHTAVSVPSLVAFGIFVMNYNTQTKEGCTRRDGWPLI